VSPREGRADRVRAVDAGVPDDQWRRVHPISPVLNAWKALAALLAIIVYQNADLVVDVLNSSWARRSGAGVVALVIIAGLVVFLAVAAIYSWLAWRATSYAVTDSAVWYRSGILFRSQRHARLDRVQSVDLVHPLLGRIFGLGRLSVEVAGGSGSNLSVGFLATAVLEDLRAEILGRAAGLRPDAPSDAPTSSPAHPGGESGEPGTPSSMSTAAGAPAGPAPRTAPSRMPVARERLLYTVAPGRLVASLLLSPGVVISVLMALGFLVGAVILAITVGPEALSAMAGVIPAALVGISMAWGRFAGEFNFQAAVSPDGIRVRRGLTQTSAQTIPPRRVHAVSIEQPLLWRRRGWYRVTISQAGYAANSGNSESGSDSHGDVLLPVGTREQAELALWMVVRDLGVEDPQAFLTEGLEGTGELPWSFLPNPASSRVMDPVVWRRRAVALTGTVLAVRDGRFSRSLSVTPVERLQSVAVSQGPWERRRGLADLDMQIVAGSVHAHARHVDADRAADLAGRLLVLARQRRATEPPERWMTRVAEQAEQLESEEQS